jgi:transporter family-2 protein
LLSYIIAAIAGAAMAVQGTFNWILGEKTGGFEAAFIVHVIGAVLLGIILLSGRTGGNFSDARSAPWFSFLGGPLSVLIVWGVLTSIGKIGVAPATTAIVGAQIFMALFLDVLGVAGQKVPLCAGRCIGAVVFVIGAYLLLKKPG